MVRWRQGGKVEIIRGKKRNRRRRKEEMKEGRKRVGLKEHSKKNLAKEILNLAKDINPQI